MIADDVFRSRLQSTITALRYWAPSIADAAHIEEAETGNYWKIIVAPTLAQASRSGQGSMIADYAPDPPRRGAAP